MPQESYGGSIFNSPGKNYRGLKGLIYYNNGDGCNNSNKDDDASSSYAEEVISDSGLAHRKAEEAARRRYEAAQWLRRMDHSASEMLSDHPTEEEFCLALRNGLILCNVLNKINPGAVHKVVENPVVDVQATEGAAQSAIQYFENMRNFLVAVAKMKLLTFEASHIEKGGSSGKVVDCILCLKGYYEWKLSGGIGVWRYGGMIKITSFPKESSSSAVTSESADDSLDDSESSHCYDQLTDFLHLSNGSLEESKEANVTAFMFDHFSLGLLRAYLEGTNEFDDELPLSAMAIDIMLRNIVKNFSSLFLSQSNQLGIFLKKVLNSDCISPTKSQFLEAISKYLSQRSNLVSRDIASFCICDGRKCDTMWCDNISSSGGRELLDLQQKQLEALKSLFREAKQEVHQAQLGWENEFKWLGDHVKGLEVAASSYHKALEENRMLYNQVQDLKGTIRVYCRVRPFLQGGNGQSTVDYIGENGSIMIVNPLKQGRDARKVFTFNKVFGTNVTQQQIYEDTQPLVRSVLDGYNVCIFAYGQTGSGKTYTMSGPDLMTEETWGVNYRALRDLFDISKARNNVVEYEVGVQMIEIYNEQVRDLLVSDGSNRRLDIRNNSQLNGLNVPDASLIPVSCTEDVLDLMRIGQTNRAVGATALNERSSRSHSILTVHVRGRELVSGSILKGCLHLVDLAGSERVNKSEAVGERLKEAQHINRSLSALGDVIAALAQKNSHVPYRNSKLTQVLQDSLGGHAKTLMFVHINPEVNAIGETISTMKFAERVATIDLGAAQSNKETNEIRDFKEEISNLKSTLEKKEAELEQLKIKATNRGVISPLRMPKHDNNNACSKPEINQQPADTQNTAGRSCSSGKQRRSKFPSSKFTDRDPSPKVSFLIEEMLQDSAKPRSPSPPIKRSTSTDRAFHTRLRVKPDQFENSPFTKLPFPSGVTINRSTARVPSHLPPSVSSTRNPEEPPFHDPLSGVERVTIRKIKPEVEEERFKQVCNVRHKTISKQNSTKFKIKNDSSVATSFQKLKVSEALLLSDKDHTGKMREEESHKVDSLDHDKEHVVPLKLPPNGANTRSTKLHRTFSRNSQNVEPRELIQAEDQQVNKYSNAVTANGKESINISAPELRRSRSTPRGKFML